MSAEDWETKYKEIWAKYVEEKGKSDILKDRMTTKQERYIAREQEYRRTIDQIEDRIKEESTRPLEIIQTRDDAQLLLQGIDPNLEENRQQLEKERFQKLKNEMQINQKNVREIQGTYDKIGDTIRQIQEGTAKDLWKQRSEIWQTLDRKLDEIKA